MPLSGENSIYVYVNPAIDQILKEEEQQSVIELEKRINRRIIIVSKDTLHMEQYEIRA